MLYKQENEQQEGALVQDEETEFCLNDFFRQGAGWLADKVFETSSFFLSSAQILVEEESLIYVQVKLLKVTTNFRCFNVLQIIDISKQVLYHVTAG